MSLQPNCAEVRIQKWLSSIGVASRREAESWIEEGRVGVNGKTLDKQGVMVNPERDRVTLDGNLVRPNSPPRVYWLLNKPDKVISSRKDPQGRKTIFDLPKLSRHPFRFTSVGRLDYRTEGLLILSNHGELVHRLTHPSFKVPRCYEAVVSRKLAEQEIHEIRKGLSLSDGVVKGTKIKPLGNFGMGGKKLPIYSLSVLEGRNRLVRRIFEHFDVSVEKLVRTGFGDIWLDNALQPGDYRALTSKEVSKLKSWTNLSSL